MGDSAGEPARDFQLLRLPEPVLEQRTVGDVARVHDDPAHRRLIAQIETHALDHARLPSLAFEPTGEGHRPLTALAKLRHERDPGLAIRVRNDPLDRSALECGHRRAEEAVRGRAREQQPPVGIHQDDGV